MKQTKSRTAKRPARSGSAAAGKKTIHRKRPIHKRVLLHPFSVMVLLCVGVLVAGSTLRSSAESYEVTATVPAPLATVPAVITDPVDQQHFSSVPAAVSGTCPPQSYVKLYRGNDFSGVGLCTSGAFQISTDLSAGENQLSAHVFNLTDQEGPASPSVTVFYDDTSAVPTAPAATPTSLWIENVEAGAYKVGTITTSDNPTVTGFAPPYSDIVVTFHSVVSICRTQANAQGWWSCTLDNHLEPGRHQVDVVATTADGQQLIFPSFHIQVLSNIPSLRKSSPLYPFLIQSPFLYQAHRTDQLFSFSLSLGGGKAPYSVHVTWGDGEDSAVMRQDKTEFIISHAYNKPGDYTVAVQITDATGTSSTMQLVAVVKGASAPASALTALKPPNNLLLSVLAGIKQYLWVVWPVYIAVVLMVLSYWIGEQEAYRRLINRRVLHRPVPKGKAR